MLRLTGVWKKITKDDKVYYSGSLGGAKIVVLSNTMKQSDKDPDLIIYLAEKSNEVYSE